MSAPGELPHHDRLAVTRLLAQARRQLFFYALLERFVLGFCIGGLIACAVLPGITAVPADQSGLLHFALKIASVACVSGLVAAVSALNPKVFSPVCAAAALDAALPNSCGRFTAWVELRNTAIPAQWQSALESEISAYARSKRLPRLTHSKLLRPWIYGTAAAFVAAFVASLGLQIWQAHDRATLRAAIQESLQKLERELVLQTAHSGDETPRPHSEQEEQVRQIILNAREAVLAARAAEEAKSLAAGALAVLRTASAAGFTELPKAAIPVEKDATARMVDENARADEPIAPDTQPSSPAENPAQQQTARQTLAELLPPELVGQTMSQWQRSGSSSFTMDSEGQFAEAEQSGDPGIVMPVSEGLPQSIQPSTGPHVPMSADSLSGFAEENLEPGADAFSLPIPPGPADSLKSEISRKLLRAAELGGIAAPTSEEDWQSLRSEGILEQIPPASRAVVRRYFELLRDGQ